MECLKPDTESRSLSKLARPSREDRLASHIRIDKVRSLYLDIFMVDIKLALGNNSHLFTIFPWNLLEPSWRLRHPSSVFCC